MSERIADRRKLMDEAEGTMSVLHFEHPLPESDEDEDYIDTGAAILNFYCTLVDLLGRCAPDASVIAQVTSSRLYTVYKKHAIQQDDKNFRCW
jgi:ryanodine receptor 2